jgi:cytoskeletal protein CcmA (bactofilin family)
MWNQETSPKIEAVPNRYTPSAASPAVNGRPPDERRGEAWVGKSVVFRGDLISSEDMTIDGRVEGTIEVRDHRLTIGPNASIEADIVAKSVMIFGKVAGSVTGQDKVEIRLSASVEADVMCGYLSIQEGAHFCGKVTMDSRRPQQAEGPTTHEATAASM